MGKTISSIRITAFVLILFQVVLLAVFTAFYFANWFDFQSYVTTEYVIAGASLLVFVDCIFVWIIALRFSAIRKKTDLHAAEVIGSDVQEAYNFAMLGLAVVDENDVVLWTNDLFQERHIEIIDQNILTWHPELRALRESTEDNAVVKLSFNSRTYMVELLSEAGLYIFKDTTDFENIYNYSKEQAPVVGLLALDNYADVVKTEDDFNDMVTKVKNVIFQYAKDFGILLRRYRNDTYFMLANYETLMKMKQDSFSLVNKVRELGQGEDVPITLSIGIAHDFPDVVKLNDLADEALSIAMSRGGDQVVISKYGSDMEFIGGKTEAQENRNRVKIRVLADSLLGLIKASTNVLVMGHTQMDMDSLGSCLGIKAMCNRVEKPCMVVVDLKATESKTRSAITSCFSREELERLMVGTKEANDLVKPNTLIIVVDVHIPNMVMAPSLLEKASKVVVIDHHRRAEEYIDSPVFNHIDPSSSSASEIITEFIRFASINPKIVLPSTYATIMLSGIFLDSGYFKSKNCGIRSFEAATILKEFGADNATAYDLLKDDFEEFTAVNNFIVHRETPVPGVVYCAVDDKIYDSATIAKAANTCLSMKSINAAFAIGLTSNKEIRMSCRSDGTINVQLLAERMGGGGHFTSAAVAFEKTDMRSVIDTLLKTINLYINEARSDSKRPGSGGGN